MKKTRVPSSVRKTLIRFFRGELRPSPSSPRAKDPLLQRYQYSHLSIKQNIALLEGLFAALIAQSKLLLATHTSWSVSGLQNKSQAALCYIFNTLFQPDTSKYTWSFIILLLVILIMLKHDHDWPLCFQNGGLSQCVVQE